MIDTCLLLIIIVTFFIPKRRDLILFQPGNWLNDACINYCLRRLEEKILDPSILFLDPAVVSFLRIQCVDDDEYAELAVGTDILQKTWVFIPLNDSDSFSHTSSHWSLLLLHVSSGKLYHFDSSGRHNQRAAESTCAKIYKLLGRVREHPNIPIMHLILNTPKQNNGNDCGVYVVLQLEAIVFRILSKEPILVVDYDWNEFSSKCSLDVTEKSSDSFRGMIYNEIIAIAGKN
jgi:Ulp1 family protease